MTNNTSTDSTMNKQAVILAVDDNALNLQLISSLLTGNGYKVVVTGSGINALKYLSLKQPDLVLLDVMMPGMSGYEVLQNMRSNPATAEIPVIFLTAKAELNDIIYGFKLGAVDYITKPFRNEEVLARVQTHVELLRAKQELNEKNIRLNELTKELEVAKKELEFDADRLVELNAQKDRFFSIIAHDLRGSFAGCLGATQLLIDNFDDFSKEELGSFITEMGQTATQLNKLLENLLGWAQVQMGLTIANITPCDAGTIISNALTNQLYAAQAKQIELSSSIPQPVKVLADSNIVDAILRNLISNAIKFTPSNGRVQVNCHNSADGNNAIISVVDNGIGMSESMLKKLFKISENVSRSGTNGEISTGLGLILSNDFAKKMNAHLTVESAVNKGSVFHLILPLATD